MGNSVREFVKRKLSPRAIGRIRRKSDERSVLAAEGLQRLRDYSTSMDDPCYLVYRGLFAGLEKASVHARGKLLDIGCGNKPYERMFKGRITEYIGCDVVQSSDERADVICPATLISIEDASFDPVLCTQVIEHVADHRGLIREAFRLLKSGGFLILSG